MLEIIDKLVIFLCCVSIYLLESAHGLFIFPVILVLTLSSINSYFENNKLHVLSFIIYGILCMLFSELLIFLPLILYDVICSKYRFIALFALVPIVSNEGYLSNRITFITLAFIAFTILLKVRTTSDARLKKDYINFRDKTSELSIKLEDQNASLIVNKDYEINLARNRIAREIHDNVGHILSRCLLQIGALIVINKETTIKENLNGVVAGYNIENGCRAI